MGPPTGTGPTPRILTPAPPRRLPFFHAVTVPFASLSIHTFVDKIGAYCGFASIIGLAILILLFFSHARETANLRSRLAEAQERINALEGRLAQFLRMQARRGAAQPPMPAQPPVAPVTAARQPMGTAVTSVRRPAAAEGAPPVPRYAGAGVAAPALASATSLISAPGMVGRSAAATKAGRTTPAVAAAASEDTVLVPAGAATAAATAAPAGGGNGRARAAATPPPTRTRPATAPPRGAPAGRNAAAARNAAARAQGRPDGQAAAPGGRGRGQAPPSLQQPPPNRSVRRRVLSALAGLVVVAGVVVALLVVTNNGGTTNSNVHHPGAKTNAKHQGDKSKKHAPAVKPSKVTVAVLNGTAVSNLAEDVSQHLGQQGYQQGPITNAAVQTQSHTIVAYLDNNIREADAVAKSLGLPASSVQKADQTTIQSCETPVTGVTTGSTTPGSTSCEANVIVTVGSDKASLASTTSS